MARNFVAASTQFLNRTASIPLTGPPFTFASWFKPTSTIQQYLLSLERTASFQIYGMSGRTDGAVEGQAFDGSSAAQAISSGTYTLNAWNHAAYVASASNSYAAYLNGGNKGTSSTSSTPTVDRIEAARRFTGGSPNSYFDGDLAEAAIWNVALTDTEVLMLSLGVSPLQVRPSALVAYWPLYGLNSPENDLMVGQYNLTLNNTPVQAAHVRAFKVRTPATAMISPLAIAKYGWHGSYPDILLDTTSEIVASGFIPRTPADSVDPTPN